jgi:endoglucanase
MNGSACSLLRIVAAAILLAQLAMGPAWAQRNAACPELMAGGVDLSLLQRLSRGVNLAGWMDSATSPRPDPAVLRALRKAGFGHVRLPVPGEQVMSRFTDEAGIKAQLARVEAAVAELVAMGFVVSVDLHPGEQFGRLHRDDGKAGMAAAKDGWRHLAGLVKRFLPGSVLAELLNEPDLDPDLWQAQAEELATYVRTLLPDTTLVIGPTYWQRADSLPRFKPLADLNVVYAIHVYDPMIFTHQGHWDPQSPLYHVRELPYPVDAASPAVQGVRRHLERVSPSALRDLDVVISETRKGDLLLNSLKLAVQWQQKFKRPLIINEFGVLKEHAPPASRARWLKTVVQAAEASCWGWAHWELEQGFGLVDHKTGRLDPTIMKALTGKP